MQCSSAGNITVSPMPNNIRCNRTMSRRRQYGPTGRREGNEPIGGRIFRNGFRLQCAIKRLAHVAGRSDVCLFSDPLARSCEGQFLQKAFKRMWRALRVHPRAVLFVDVEHSRGAWRHSQSAVALSSQKAVPSRRGVANRPTLLRFLERKHLASQWTLSTFPSSQRHQ